MFRGQGFRGGDSLLCFLSFPLGDVHPFFIVGDAFFCLERLCFDLQQLFVFC